jgi:hypothetical protein
MLGKIGEKIKCYLNAKKNKRRQNRASAVNAEISLPVEKVPLSL